MTTYPRRRSPGRFLIVFATLSFAAGVLPAAGAEAPDVRLDPTVLAVQKVLHSVVNIATSKVVEEGDFYDPIFNKFYGPTWYHEELNSIGSGVIIDPHGYVLTNVHVLRHAWHVEVKLWNGRVYDAEPMFLADTNSDLAVLKLRCKPGEQFEAIRLADDEPFLGETVLALGDPFGLGESVSRGILSSKSRRPPRPGEPLNIANWLQTDAAINPGNSGGPLVDLRGEMIGLDVAIYPAGSGIGFAIPAREVSAALSQMFTPELTGSLWFGAQVKAGTSPLRISSVQTNSPAWTAGLRQGQKILRVNGQAPGSLVEFDHLVVASPEHRVSFTVQQDGKSQDLNATLIPFDELIRQKTGLTLADATNAAKPPAAWFSGRGMVIKRVEAGSPAAKAGLQPGILLTGVDGIAADRLLDVGEALATHKAGDIVPLTVEVVQRLGTDFPGFPASATVNLRLR